MTLSKASVEQAIERAKFFELESVCLSVETLKTILQDLKNYQLLQSYVIKWDEQLCVDGVNSKGMVRADIQHLKGTILWN